MLESFHQKEIQVHENLTVRIRHAIGRMIMKSNMRKTSYSNKISFKGTCESAKDVLQYFDNTQRLLNIAMIMIIGLDRHGRILLTNRHACKILEYEEKEIVGKNWFDNFLPKNAKDEARKTLMNLVEGKTGQYQSVEHNVVTKTGAERTISWCHTVLKDESGKITGTLSSGTDVTERKELEQCTRESEIRYRELVEKADVAMLLDDIRGNFRYFNKNFSGLFGYTYTEMKSKSIEQLIHPDDMNKVAQYQRDRLKGTDIPKKYEFKALKKDGTPIWIEVNVVALEEDGEVVGTRAYIWDISERKIAEQELHTLSMVDELTGLYNRRGFSIFAEQQIRVADRTGKGFFIIVADLDRMKWINDDLGNKEGDQALKDVANVLGRSFRKSDVIARVGGDEFAIIAADALRSGESIIVGRMLRNISLENSRRKKYNLAISVGAAYYDPTKVCTLDDLLSQADHKMNEHKKIKQELTQENLPS